MSEAKASIISWGETEYGLLHDRDRLDLVEDAAYGALRRADLRPDDVDGLITSVPRTNLSSAAVAASELAEHLGFMPSFKYGTVGGVGGASAILALQQAEHAVTRGQCEYVMIVYGDNRATGLGQDTTGDLSALAGHDEFETPYGPTVASMFALWARKHMSEYGTTEEQLAEIATIAYENASQQPAERSHLQKTPSVGDVLDSNMISSPLTLHQCCLISDGAAAVLVTSRDNAVANHRNPVDIQGVGASMSHESCHQSPNFTSTAANEAAQEAFASAGVGPNDIDAIGVYDAFTISVLIALEDMGFCSKGEGGSLVDSGALSIDGKWPINPHGGQLAQAHPGVAAGLLQVTEMVQQIRGNAHVQIDGVNRALVHGNGGPMANQSVAVLGGGT